MQIDFHHAVTYVVARFAGFDHDPAATIAHAAQYVDDSSESGFVHFDNEMRFYRQASAHPVYDLANMDDDTDAESWLPFHFLPGNGGLPEGQNPTGPYIQRLICRPGSPVAEAMAACALDDKGSPWELHRLGIAAHVYADTWAHQGFVGLNDPINGAGGFLDGKNGALPGISGALPPVGHGQAATYPDMPYLVWSYVDAGGNHISRNNPGDFLAAADALCRMFQSWLGVSAVTGLDAADRAALSSRFTRFVQSEGYQRHARWLMDINKGEFRFGPASLDYDPDIWKNLALGDTYSRKLRDMAGLPHPWTPGFPACDWKLFHDAARCQRHDVFVKVLPRFGILEN